MAELIIAVAISSVVVLASLGFTSDALLKVKKSDSATELSVDFDLLTDYFSREVPNAGGQDLPAQAAYYVENNCAVRGAFPNCHGSDRLTLASADQAGACKIQTWTVATQQAVLNSVAGVCCFDATFMNRRQVMFSNGSSYAQKWIASVDVPTCSVRFTNGPMAANDNVVSTYDWLGGIVVPVSVVTYYLDDNVDQFNVFNYTDAGTTAAEGISSIIADRTLDFQVALGFDFNPADGAIVDTASNNDEWLYNQEIGVAESRTVAPFNNAPSTSLKMIHLGWLIGAPSSATPAVNLKLLDGPNRSRANWLLRKGAIKLSIKSTYIFE